MCHITDVLYHTNTATFRSLCRAQETPTAVVQFARSHQFAVLVNRCVDPTKVAKTANVSQPIENLCYANLIACSVLDGEVARGERGLQAVLKRS